ncbi:glycosyltransferase family 9 protein [Bradyrhizobium sp. Ai1a-2]|uniref:glycosyltransferase family 9 protein n=1 Tax=Bradyrhizobium sp. Ai1a-2 TaxID=196490 RepID=UPI0004122E39|nr:glycosyltransferase family 9 protein [Bradyrhizobium sp. Ai1a-2]
MSATKAILQIPARMTAPANVAILNGFGRAMGDAIVGLQALHLAIRVGAVPPRPLLFRLPGLPGMVESVHAAADFADIRMLPWEFATPDRPFDLGDPSARVIDIRDFAFDPEFQRKAMIDFFLQRLGVAPERVPAGWRRNSWLASRVKTKRPALPSGYTLVCPKASMRLRDMPDEIHAHILRRMLTFGPVVTQGAVPDALSSSVIHLEPCASLDDLCSVVRHARWMISTDTGMVHLADAFGVGCLAFFPTHRPEWRVRDYPRTVSLELPTRLPRGIEFARDPRDYALARASWFFDGDDLKWLDLAVDQALGRFASRG